MEISNNAVELWAEIGAELVDTATGPQTLLVSGHDCRVDGLHISQAGQVGLKVTGDECWIGNIMVKASTVAYDIDGNLTTLVLCSATGHTTTGFDISGNYCIVRESSAIGTDGATRGYYLSANTADYNTLKDCNSAGNGTAGFEIVAGCVDNTIKNCSSGAGDGRWVDADHNSTWPDFTLDDEVFHMTTFSGDGPSSDNIFKITGLVEIQYIYGDVETQLNADVDDIYLDLWDGTNSVEITDNGGGGTDTDNADVGSVFAKTEIATTVISLMKSDQCRVRENTNSKKPRLPFLVSQKKDTNTYIRVVYSGVATSGTIHWHCKWVPLTEDGFVEAV